MSADDISAEKRSRSARWLVLGVIALCCLLAWLFRSDVVPFFYAQLVRTGHRDVRRWAVQRMSASRLAGTDRQCLGLLADSDEERVVAALHIVQARVQRDLMEVTAAEIEKVAALLDREPSFSDNTEMDVLRVLGVLLNSRRTDFGVPAELPPSVGQALAKYLDHPNAGVRQRAESYLTSYSVGEDLGVYLILRLEGSSSHYKRAVLRELSRDALTLALYLDKPAIDALAGAAMECAQRGRYEEVEWSLPLLAHAGGNEILDFIAGFADHENPEVRAAAARTLGPMGNLRHVSLLMGLLQDDEPEVRWWAAVALGQIGDSAALPLLVEMAEAAGDEETLALALSAIGHLGDPEGEDVLVRHLSSPSERVAWQAVYSLSLCGSTAATRSIAKLLDDPREEVREVAHMSVSLLCPDGPGYEADTAEWREWLRRQGREDGRSAFSIPREIKILQGFGTGHQRVIGMRPAGLMPELRRWMDGPDPFKRVLAAELLSAWGEEDAIEALITGLGPDSQSEGNRLSALRALRRATGENFFGDVEKWQEWYDDGCPGFPVLPPPRRISRPLEPASRASSPSGHSDSEPRGGVRGAGSPGRGASHD